MPILLLMGFATNAQHNITLKEYGSVYYKRGLIGTGITYVKDLNNIRDKYVGTWRGTRDGKTVTFYIEKYTRVSDLSTPNITFDELLIRYRITAGSNVIIDTTSLEDTNPLVISSSYLANSGSYVFHYIAKESKCGQSGHLYVDYDSVNTQLRTTINLEHRFVDGAQCKGVDLYKYIPKYLVLSKISN